MVLAVEIAEFVVDQLGLSHDDVCYHTESRVKLGYINNKTMRFYAYVSNRVDRIRITSRPEQWSYVSTERNPADSGTRCLNAAELQNSTWLLSPSNLHRGPSDDISDDRYPLVDPEEDKEFRPIVKSMKSRSHVSSLLSSERFERFSSRRRLAEAIASLKHKARLHN